MKDSAEAAGAPVLIENRETIVPGVAAVDDDRQLRRARLRELPAKNLLLHVARRMIVVIVEAHLAPADHRGLPRQLVELREMFLGDFIRVVRMDADGGVDPVVLLGKWNRGVEALVGPVPLPMASRFARPPRVRDRASRRGPRQTAETPDARANR